MYPPDIDYVRKKVDGRWRKQIMLGGTCVGYYDKDPSGKYELSLFYLEPYQASFGPGFDIETYILESVTEWMGRAYRTPCGWHWRSEGDIGYLSDCGYGLGEEFVAEAEYDKEFYCVGCGRRVSIKKYKEE